MGRILSIMIAGIYMSCFANAMAAEPAVEAPSESRTGGAGSGALFKKIDADGDGKVEADEYRFFLIVEYELVDEGLDGEVTRDEFSSGEKKIFAGADASGDAVIDAEEKNAAIGNAGAGGQEFSVLTMDENGEWMVNQYVKGGLWASADTNADEKITVEEWLDAADRKFTEMDVDGDGIVTQDEFMAFLMGPTGKTVGNRPDAESGRS